MPMIRRPMTCGHSVAPSGKLWSHMDMSFLTEHLQNWTHLSLTRQQRRSEEAAVVIMIRGSSVTSCQGKSLFITAEL